MFTKIQGVVTVPRSAPEVAREAAADFAHLMANVGYMTTDQMADAIDANYDNVKAQAVAAELRQWTTTVNMMNPGAGEIAIEKSRKGGACDVGMERFWSM